MRAPAACNVFGRFMSGIDWSTSTDSFSGVCTWTPVSTQTGTESLKSWLNTLKYVMPRRRAVVGLRRHPAAPNTRSIFFVNWIASSSWKTLNVYSVSWKGVSSAINAGSSTIDRGERILFSSASAWAKCDSASAAYCLAETMSFSNESASVLAPCAKVRADDAAFRALLASFSALFIAPSAAPVLLSASLACDSAVPEIVNAWDASLEACLALASSEPISCSERESFLCPYGNAAISASTAMAKKQIPILSKSLSLDLFSVRWAKASAATSSAKNTSAAPSKSVWARLTDSSEFQSGRMVAKCIIVAFILVGAFVSRLLRYRKKWKVCDMTHNPSTRDHSQRGGM